MMPIYGITRPQWGQVITVFKSCPLKIEYYMQISSWGASCKTSQVPRQFTGGIHADGSAQTLYSKLKSINRQGWGQLHNINSTPTPTPEVPTPNSNSGQSPEYQLQLQLQLQRFQLPTPIPTPANLQNINSNSNSNSGDFNSNSNSNSGVSNPTPTPFQIQSILYN